MVKSNKCIIKMYVIIEINIEITHNEYCNTEYNFYFPYENREVLHI